MASICLDDLGTEILLSADVGRCQEARNVRPSSDVLLATNGLYFNLLVVSDNTFVIYNYILHSVMVGRLLFQILVLK